MRTPRFPRPQATGRISWRTLAWCSVAAGLLSLPLSASAEIYQWTDANGKVHFSDKPPAGTSARKRSQTGDPAVRVARGGGSARYRGSQPSRRARLEKVKVELEGRTGSRIVVGTVGRGALCRTRSEMVAVGGEAFDVSRSRLPRRFDARLAELGYATADRKSFAQQIQTFSEISIAATLVDVERKQCQAYTESRRRVAERNSTRLEVRWEVFDNLTREIVLEARSAGFYSDFQRPRERNGAQESIARAFVLALDRLLARDDFQALMAASTDDRGPAAVPARLDVDLAYAEPGVETFSSRIAALKAATVTIRTVAGHGSGFLIAQSGHVLTNHHVVRGSSELLVLFENQELPARIVAEDPRRDIALLRLERPPSEVDPLVLAKTRAQVGETVYVIGTPLDESLSHTVTRGIISAERELSGQRFLQTDAAVNPGNSGGPALNERGEVVGVAVAGVFNRNGASMNINYLIPIDHALARLGLGETAD